MPVIPPASNQPTSAIIRAAKDYERQEKAEAKRREDERKRALAAELRRKASETSQKR